MAIAAADLGPIGRVGVTLTGWVAFALLLLRCSDRLDLWAEI